MCTGPTREGVPSVPPLKEYQMAKVRYFITKTTDGRELPRMIWSSEVNACVAMARPGIECGLFITVNPNVCKILEHMQYVEIKEDDAQAMGFNEPYEPDRIDYTIREDPKITAL
jgi:hypothetical protein